MRANHDYMLTMLTCGKTLALVQLAESRHRLASWQNMVGGYVFKMLWHTNRMLNEISLFDFPRPPGSSMETRERSMPSYNQVCSAQLSDAIRITLVMDHLGDDRVHDHL